MYIIKFKSYKNVLSWQLDQQHGGPDVPDNCEDPWDAKGILHVIGLLHLRNKRGGAPAAVDAATCKCPLFFNSCLRSNTISLLT